MDKTIFEKLHVTKGMKYLICNAPKDFPMPEDCFPMDTIVNYVHIFCETAAMLHYQMDGLTTYDLSACKIWVSYPKKTSALHQDLDRNVLWDIVLPYGFHPVSQVSLDETWSAIRLKPNEDCTEYQRPKTK